MTRCLTRQHPPSVTRPAVLFLSPLLCRQPVDLAGKRRESKVPNCPWKGGGTFNHKLHELRGSGKSELLTITVSKQTQDKAKMKSARKPARNLHDLRSQPEGTPRRKLFQQGTERPPAFVDFPVVIHDLGGGWARSDKLGPWHRSQLLANAVGAVCSIRLLPSGKWLIGCITEAQQSTLARL